MRKRVQYKGLLCFLIGYDGVVGCMGGMVRYLHGGAMRYRGAVTR